MSESSSMSMDGAISWTSIPVQDVHRAMKFYKDVFGWEYNLPYSTCPETGEKNKVPNYYGFVKGPAHGSFNIVEPLHHLSPARHPDNKDKQKIAVTVTISTDSTMEEAITAVEKAGGMVYLPTHQIPGENMGYLTHFLDTEKNVMGLWALH